MCLFFFFCIVVWIIWLDVCSMWITGSVAVVARVTSKFIVRFDVWLQSHTNWHMLWYVIALGDALRTKPLTRNHLCALLYRNHLQTQSSKLQTHTPNTIYTNIFAKCTMKMILGIAKRNINISNAFESMNKIHNGNRKLWWATTIFSSDFKLSTSTTAYGI